MKIKSILALAAAIAVAATASAQLSVNAGYQNQGYKMTTKMTLMGTENTSKQDTTMSGFFIGATYNVQIAGGFGVAPGLYFSYAGSSDENTVGSITSHSKMTDMSLELPILLNYGLELGSDMKVFAFAGPVVNFGLSLKDKSWLNDDKDNATTVNMYDTDPDKDDEDNLSRFDLGVAFGAGFQFSNYRVYAGYNLGLLDRANFKAENDNLSITYKGSNLFVGVGMSF